jgi:hypothetical protein
MNKLTQSELRMQMLAGVITEGQYAAAINQEIENTEKDSLNESMIGGIVGIGAINQIPSRAKTDYEDAFEHFLGERYQVKPNRERDDIEDINEEDEIEEAMVPSNTSDKLDYLEDLFSKVYKMGRLEAPLDFKMLAKSTVNDMFGDLEEGKEVEEPTNY